MTQENEICSRVLQMLKERNVAVLGIDGLGGAGKSTISEQLRAQLEGSGIHVILLHIDDFIHPKRIRYNSDHPAWRCYYDLQWRYDYFAQCLQNCRNSAGAPVMIELYDKENDSYFTQEFTVQGNTVILVEGIFLQRKELQGLFDCIVYLDVPEDVRLRRVLERDTYIGDAAQITEKYETRYFPAERHYFQTCRPDRCADVVIAAE